LIVDLRRQFGWIKTGLYSCHRFRMEGSLIDCSTARE